MKKNILRPEYKIVRRLGLQAKFRKDLTTNDLLNPIIYWKLLNLFIETYQAIPRFGWKSNIEVKEKVTLKNVD